MTTNLDMERFEQCIGHHDYHIVAIDDQKQGRAPLVFRKRLIDCEDELHTLNKQGFGIFMTVNKLKDVDSPQHKKSDFESYIGVYLDCDNPNDETPKPENPTMVVETSPGKKHYYWILEQPTKDWNAIDSMLARAVHDYGADPAATDSARILRVPGFYNHKPSNLGKDGKPPLVSLRTYNEQQKYKLSDLRGQEFFPKLPRSARKKIVEFTKRPYTEKELIECEEALPYINPDNPARREGNIDTYADWRNVIFGIHDVFGHTDKGLDLAISWSSGELTRKLNPDFEAQTWEKEKEAGVEKLWHSIQPDGKESTIQLGSIRYLAKLDPNYERKQIEDYSIELINPSDQYLGTESVREEFLRVNAKVAMNGSTRYVKRTPMDDPQTYTFYGEKDLKLATEHIRIPDPSKQNPNRTVSIFDKYRYDPQIIFFGGGTHFKPVPNRYITDIQEESILDDNPPNAPEHSKKLNLFLGFTHKPRANTLHLAKIQTLINKGAAKGDKSVIEYLHNYAAHMVQKPHVKMPILITFVGGKGSGKSQLASLIGATVHPYYMKRYNYEQLLDKFGTSSLETALFIQLEEVTWSKNEKNNSQLKNLITTSHIGVERKHVNHEGEKPVYFNMIGTANPGDTVPQGSKQDERRYLTLDFGQVAPKGDPFWESLGEVSDQGRPNTLRGDVISAYSHFLHNRDITNFDPRQIPEVKSLAAQRNREAQQSMRIHFLLTAAANEELIIDPSPNILTSSDVDSMNRMFNEESDYVLVKARSLTESYEIFERGQTHYNKVGSSMFVKKLQEDLRELTDMTLPVQMSVRPKKEQMEEYSHLKPNVNYARLPSRKHIDRLHEEYLA